MTDHGSKTITIAERLVRAGVELSSGEVGRIVRRFPALTGRDVKNLLKLSALTSGGAPVTLKTVEFVEQFKPTVPAPPPERR